MAWYTKSSSIRYFKTKLREFGKSFNMVSIEFPTSFTTMHTSKVIPSKYCQPPKLHVNRVPYDVIHWSFSSLPVRSSILVIKFTSTRPTTKKGSVLSAFMYNKFFTAKFTYLVKLPNLSDGCLFLVNRFTNCLAIPRTKVVFLIKSRWVYPNIVAASRAGNKFTTPRLPGFLHYKIIA